MYGETQEDYLRCLLFEGNDNGDDDEFNYFTSNHHFADSYPQQLNEQNDAHYYDDNHTQPQPLHAIINDDQNLLEQQQQQEQQQLHQQNDDNGHLFQRQKIETSNHEDVDNFEAENNIIINHMTSMSLQTNTNHGLSSSLSVPLQPSQLNQQQQQVYRHPSTQTAGAESTQQSSYHPVSSYSSAIPQSQLLQQQLSQSTSGLMYQNGNHADDGSHFNQGGYHHQFDNHHHHHHHHTSSSSNQLNHAQPQHLQQEDKQSQQQPAYRYQQNVPAYQQQQVFPNPAETFQQSTTDHFRFYAPHPSSPSPYQQQPLQSHNTYHSHHQMPQMDLAQPQYPQPSEYTNGQQMYTQYYNNQQQPLQQTPSNAHQYIPYDEGRVLVSSQYDYPTQVSTQSQQDQTIYPYDQGYSSQLPPLRYNQEPSVSYQMNELSSTNPMMESASHSNSPMKSHTRQANQHGTKHRQIVNKPLHPYKRIAEQRQERKFKRAKESHEQNQRIFKGLTVSKVQQQSTSHCCGHDDDDGDDDDEDQSCSQPQQQSGGAYGNGASNSSNNSGNSRAMQLNNNNGEQITGEESGSQQMASGRRKERRNSYHEHEGYSKCGDEGASIISGDEKNSRADEIGILAESIKHCNKKNVVKNIMSAFLTFMNDRKFKLYSEEEQECIPTLYHCQDTSAATDEDDKIEEIRKKFKRYISQKSLNHYTVRLLILHPNYGPIFRYYLTNPIKKWINSSKVADLSAHVKMIGFFLACFQDHHVLEELKRHEKKRAHFS